VTARTIYVDHVVVPAGGTPRVLRTVRDQVDRCAREIVVEVRTDAFDVTDLDGDGIAEVTFAYEVGCRDGNDPMPYKLLVLEDGVKYILRGAMRRADPRGDGKAIGGGYEPAPAAAKWPKAFLDHAKAVWERTDADPDDPPPRGDAGHANPCGG
jgi:hypothetical protein